MRRPSLTRSVRQHLSHPCLDSPLESTARQQHPRAPAPCPTSPSCIVPDPAISRRIRRLGSENIVSSKRCCPGKSYTIALRKPIAHTRLSTAERNFSHSHTYSVRICTPSIPPLTKKVSREPKTQKTPGGPSLLRRHLQQHQQRETQLRQILHLHCTCPCSIFSLPCTRSPANESKRKIKQQQPTHSAIIYRG
ncbi:hypothetical protein BU26DRAFT_127989 [Trematosphaeria pertusa]|uniref:Uncharacterized protein n=1 Tax=Trematosphaeria pertusa TaxID=390896 RepID=A0A6A6HWF6_9PLEO|nr:uncharacterized protein BU26DRAFT_127989 [Trematosphaeria pertusa]KAF2242525.1 hypothetical protein BU26DRAFT_127989 [Trematosphaeria pertusa]